MSVEMRFGGILALLCFSYVVLTGLVQGTGFVPLLQHALAALGSFFVFGSVVGQLGETVTVEDLSRNDFKIQKELLKIQRETEELSGISRNQVKVQSVETANLEPDSMLAEEVVDTMSGQVLFPIGATITEDAIGRLVAAGIRRVKIAV